MTNNKWNLTDLNVLCAVVKTGSFVGASEELGMAQASVSKRIADLEKSLGVLLFRRTTRSVQITSEGILAHTRALQVLDAATRLQQDISSARIRPSGKLRISTSLRLGRNYIAPILSKLAKEYPELDIWLELVDRRVDMLNEGYDIDIRAGDVTEPHLISHKVVKSQRMLCASKAYLERKGTPKTLDDLALHDCLLFRHRDQMLGVWRLQNNKEESAVRITGGMGSNHADVIHEWAEQGLGIAMLSDWDIHDKLAKGKLVRILPDYTQQTDIWAVTPSRLTYSATLKLCVEYLIESLQSGPHALPVSSD
jgi:LysR family transcriptional regulator, transcriptional activator for dmlA